MLVLPMDALSPQDPCERVVCKFSSQVGKALSLDTPIATPAGFKPMGEMQIGDVVFDEAGKPCNVLSVSEVFTDHECYQLTFSDGAVIVADAGHRWLTRARDVGKVAVRRTSEIAQTLRVRGKERTNNHSVAVCVALDLPDAALPIDPYALGVWLGDGNSASLQITMHENDLEIAEYLRDVFPELEIRQNEKRNASVLNIKLEPNRRRIGVECLRGHVIAEVGLTKKGRCRRCSVHYTQKHQGSRRLDDIVNPYLSTSMTMREMGLMTSKERPGNEKHIPPAYFRGSARQRHALLKGLMDTDGYLGNGRQVEFCSVSERLADDVKDLACTLGVKAYIKRKATRLTYKGELRQGVCYLVRFSCPNGFNPFRMKRKHDPLEARHSNRESESLSRFIVSADRIEPVPVRCISVDSESHLYLAGRELIPTHNTEIGLNFAGYQMHQDPGPMLIVQPTKMPMGETFAKDRIQPMLRDTPALAKMFSGVKSKDGGNTIYHKVYPGGQLTVAGANSPSQLASRPIRYLYCDELDRWVVTKEGNALLQARARMKAFHNSKELITSSPSFPNVGIDFEYGQCLQHEWQLVCQHCSHSQFPYFRHFLFDRDEWGNATNVQFVCKECGALHDETEEGFLKATARWVVVNDADPKYKGFWANQFGSAFVAWRDTVQEFLDAKDDPERLQVVTNTAFAECWQGAGEHLDADRLRERREVYPMKDGEILVPNKAQLIMLTVDTQDTWLDYELFAVNEDVQTWGMERGQLYGNTDEQEVWDQLEDLLERQLPTEDGRQMPIYATMIDIKGHRQDRVVKFVHDHRFMRVHGYAGQGPGAKDQISRAKKKMEDGTRRKINVFNVRTDDFKRRAMTYMARDPHKKGACHWPKLPDEGEVAGYDREHFEQLCAETMEVSFRSGKQFTKFVQKRPRNEAFDHRTMLYSLIQIAKPAWNKETRTGTARTARPRPNRATPEPAAVAAQVQTPSRIERAGFINKPKAPTRKGGNWIKRRR